MTLKRTQLDSDELNILDSKSVKKRSPRSIPYREYFGAMYIEPEVMNNRIQLAEQIENVMLYIFAYWLIMDEAGLSIDELRQDAIDELTAVYAGHAKLDSYLESHIVKVVNDVIDTTQKYGKKKEDEDEKGDIEDALEEDEKDNPIKELIGEDNEPKTERETDYWTSKDRAMYISENEANAFDNYIEYRSAVTQGKTKKKWLTELDDKVRMTHTLVEGKTVDIDGLFLVGDSLMRFPMDDLYSPNPSEVINCRCVCKYE